MAGHDILSASFWLPLMAGDLPEAKATALQPVRIEDGKAKLFASALNGPFQAGATLALERQGNRIVVAESDSGVELPEAKWWDDGTKVELPVPGDIPPFCLLVKTADAVELLPIRVAEHPADVLGPRIIDELRDSEVIRHAVKGLGYDEWTAERVAELQGLVCAEPLAYDPVAPLAEGDDWIAWKTRKEILGRPAPDDEALRRRLEDEIFADQADDGSWDGHVVKTAYGILHALSVETPPDAARVQRASEWLLAQPEPLGRPGMWMLDEPRREKWNVRKRGEEDVEWLEFMVTHYTEADHDLFRAQTAQQVVPSCTRMMHAGCDAMLHPSATAAMALCGCGLAEHPRLRAYANSMYQLSAMFGYFCACWGILDADRDCKEIHDRDPDFNRRADEHPIALAALPYGHGRDAEDLCALARLPRYPGIHRPDLSDTNGWTPYLYRDIGRDGCYALDGAYWQNADCWAKPNRALSAFPGWSGSIAELFALFQCHLYQTPLGEWNQGYPSGILRLIAEVTRATRAEHSLDDSPLLCFAASRLLRTVPWLRGHQKPDGLWHFADLPRHGDQGRPPSPRLGTYHVVAALDEFGLLEDLLPGA